MRLRLRLSAIAAAAVLTALSVPGRVSAETMWMSPRSEAEATLSHSVVNKPGWWKQVSGPAVTEFMLDGVGFSERGAKGVNASCRGLAASGTSAQKTAYGKTETWYHAFKCEVTQRSHGWTVIFTVEGKKEWRARVNYSYAWGGRTVTSTECGAYLGHLLTAEDMSCATARSLYLSYRNSRQADLGSYWCTGNPYTRGECSQGWGYPTVSWR